MVLQTTVLTQAGIETGGAVSSALEHRANILEMTQAAEETVLRPKDAGPWPHGLRAALAARIAAHNQESDLAEHYAEGAEGYAALANPAEDGAALELAEVVAFMDKVAAETRDVTAADVADLQAAGVADADIVRLAELNAFLAFQIRVIGGLRLMKDGFE